MKKLYRLLIEQLKEDFHWISYLWFALFISICITINYEVDFETKVLNTYLKSPVSYLYFFLFYALSYYAVAIPKALFTKNYSTLKNAKFWWRSVFILAVCAFDAGFVEHWYWAREWEGTSVGEFRLIIGVFNNSIGILTTILPLGIVWIWWRKDHKGFFGLKFKNVYLKPYFIMLLGMIPLIVTASFNTDFLDTYPTFKPWKYTQIFGLSHGEAGAIYETLYVLDFFNVELVFRGAMVIGMIKILGKDAILPMASTYAFLHFGKPLGETIGSIFGGYILGTLALRTGSIWGGCIIHMGLAFLMDVAAFIQHMIPSK